MGCKQCWQDWSMVRTSDELLANVSKSLYIVNRLNKGYWSIDGMTWMIHAAARRSSESAASIVSLKLTFHHARAFSFFYLTLLLHSTPMSLSTLESLLRELASHVPRSLRFGDSNTNPVTLDAKPLVMDIASACSSIDDNDLGMLWSSRILSLESLIYTCA